MQIRPSLPFAAACVALALSGCGDARDWSAAREGDTIAAYERYLRQQPQGRFSAEAREIIDRKAEDLQWQRAQGQDSVVAYLLYLEKYPEGRYVRQSMRQLQRVQRRQALAKSPRSELDDGTGFFQDLSEPRLAAGYSCPYGHDDVAWVPIRYGLYPLDVTRDVTRAIYAGCTRFSGSPTATLVCRTCRFTYRSEAGSPYWSRTSEDPDSFEGRLTRELLDLAAAAQARLQLADRPRFVHDVADGETLQESVAFTATEGVDRLSEFARQALRQLCSHEPRRSDRQASGLSTIDFECASAWRHYAIEIQDPEAATHRVRCTTREAPAEVAASVAATAG